MDERDSVKSARQLRRDTERMLPAFGPEAVGGEADFTGLAWEAVRAAAYMSGDDVRPPLYATFTPPYSTYALTGRPANGAAHASACRAARALLATGGKPKAEIIARLALSRRGWDKLAADLALVKTRDGHTAQVVYALP
jgi:hypothetical protein